ncbi:hypothetical protein MTO96_048100 [Rhipicephalus appendiculatus]
MERLLSDRHSEASPSPTKNDEALATPQDAASVSDETRTTGDDDRGSEVEGAAAGRSDSSDKSGKQTKRYLEDALEEEGRPEGELGATAVTEDVVDNALGAAAEVDLESAERRAKAALLSTVRARVRHTSGVSHVVGASDVTLDVSDPYEWSIEDVRSFLSFRANQRRRTHLLSTARYYYGYRVVADVVICPVHAFKIKLKAYALKGDFDEQLAWPVNRTPTLWFVHPSGDSERDVRLLEETTSWGLNLEGCSHAPREALYTWSGATFTSIADLRERGFMTDGKLRFCFNLERMHNRALSTDPLCPLTLSAQSC